MASDELRISKQNTGAAGELRVCADLLLRGYEVYRNVSSAGIDLVAYKNGKFMRVEVKSSASQRQNKNGWDVLATAEDRHGAVRYKLASTGEACHLAPLACIGIRKSNTPEPWS